jgi:hypothetical protein
MLIPVYFRFGEQFIGEFKVDDSVIYIYFDFYDCYKETFNMIKKNVCHENATYLLIRYIEEHYFPKFDYYPKKYFDINFNEISIYQIKKYTSVEYEEDISGVYFYKSKEIIRDKILYDIYFSQTNKIENIFIIPISTSGVINLYGQYGHLMVTFFHVNGKINGQYIVYEYSDICKEPAIITTINYVDGIKSGEYIEIYNKKFSDNICFTKEYDIYITKGLYINNKRNGEFITTSDDKIMKIIGYDNDDIKYIKKFYKNGNIYVDNTFIKNNLDYNMSYYESGNIMTKTKNNNGYYQMIHYYDNGKIAWKFSFTKKLSDNRILEIYDENGIVISESDFNDKYKSRQLLPRRVFNFTRFCEDSNVYSSAFFLQ